MRSALVDLDVNLLLMAIGAIGGGSAVGIAWILWWHRESRRPIYCPNCHDEM